MNSDRHRLHDLFGAQSDGTITPEQHAELQALLRQDAATRRLWFLHQDVDAGLREFALKAAPTLNLPRVAPARSIRWLSWRPLVSAAAGLVIGLFSASVVFGFGPRSADRITPILRESFESQTPPFVTGVPIGPDQWSGDYAEIVPAFEGVSPDDGNLMARLLRSDHQGKDAAMISRQGDLMRVVDVREFLDAANGGDAVTTLSARFNAVPYAESERYNGMVTIYALGADADLHGATEESIKRDALAFSVDLCRSVDRDPATWQTATARLLLPPGTERVLLKVSFCRVPEAHEPFSSMPRAVTFNGHFVDDVRASVRMSGHRAP